jgi:methionyl aminopeptidase
MITTKSPREIELMRRAGEIVALAHQAVARSIKAGMSTKDVDAIVEAVILANGATPSFKGYGGFPAATCTSINDTLVHGIPANEILKDGDIISVDIGANYKGYHGDSAWTYAIGTITPQAQRLMDVTRESLFEGLKFAKAGNHLSDISHAIGEYVMVRGYSVPVDYAGHGIGVNLHEDPSIPNFGPAGKGVVLKAGMTLAIEPMVHAGKPATTVLRDQWTVKTKDGSLAAHYEHTVLITDQDCEILTTLKEGMNG